MILSILKRCYGRKMVTGKFEEGKSLPIRDDEVVRRLEWAEKKVPGILLTTQRLEKNEESYCAESMFETTPCG